MRIRVLPVLFAHVFGAFLMVSCGAEGPAEEDGDELTGEAQAAISGCTMVCNGVTTKACGGACIPKAYNCTKPPGNACNVVTVREDVEPGGVCSVPDSFIRSTVSDKNTNYGSADPLQLGLLAGGEDQVLIRFDPPFVPQGGAPYLPQGAIVRHADVALTLPQTQPGATVYVHPVTATWQENTVTWSNSPGYNPVAVTSFPTAAKPIFDVTPLAACWVNGSCSNFGLLLRQDAGHSDIWSGEHPIERPTLTIYYSDCGGSCDDGNACTVDTCSIISGCVHTPIVCPPDGNACTNDACTNGVCPYTPVPNGTPCGSDGIACTNDACQSGVCTHTPVAMKDKYKLKITPYCNGREGECGNYKSGSLKGQSKYSVCMSDHKGEPCSHTEQDLWCRRGCTGAGTCGNLNAWGKLFRDKANQACNGTLECYDAPNLWSGEKLAFGCKSGATCTPHIWRTPLVLSFDPTSPVRYAPATACHTFDLSRQDDGSATQLDWPTPATPWLVWDKNRNGKIEPGELFGARSLLEGGFAENGFDALEALDEDDDGDVDADDPGFAHLLVWTDVNGDRASSPDELRPLADFGITRLPVHYEITPRCDPRGHCEMERAPFTFLDGTGRVREGALIDVHLASTND